MMADFTEESAILVEEEEAGVAAEGDVSIEAAADDPVREEDTNKCVFLTPVSKSKFLNRFQELEAIKARVREMEEEAEKLKQMQSEVDKQMTSVASSPPGSNSSLLNMSFEEKMEVDGRSVYVGNVDYGATAEELEQHFHGCGSVQRVTILCNKYDGHPKGFAYVEFTDKDSVSTAMALDDSLFRGRQIKVRKKRGGMGDRCRYFSIC